MNVLIYGSDRDKDMIWQQMKSQVCMIYRQLTCHQTEDYEEFIDYLEREKVDLVIVTTDNAAGMEGVIAVKNIHEQLPILWFSNDKNFVAQSYRLGVTYFGVKPVEERVMKLALERYQQREEYV